MKITNVREILERLGQELRRAEDIDIDARAEMRELNRHVDRIETEGGSEVDFLFDRVKQLESQFSAEHPTLSRIARELADAIAKMGV